MQLISNGTSLPLLSLLLLKTKKKLLDCQFLEQTVQHRIVCCCCCFLVHSFLAPSTAAYQTLRFSLVLLLLLGQCVCTVCLHSLSITGWYTRSMRRTHLTDSLGFFFPPPLLLHARRLRRRRGTKGRRRG